LDGIQNDDQNTDGVDWVHQNPKASQSSSSSWVDISFGDVRRYLLYAV